MKYLNNLAATLLAIEPPESREALLALLVDYDRLICRQVAAERAARAERRKLAKSILRHGS